MMEIRVDPERPDPAEIERAAARLRAGGLLAYPTETSYGLGGDATDERVLARLAALKGSPEPRPFSVLVSGPEALEALVSHVPPAARELMRRFWPGALTLVLPPRAGLPRLLAPEGGGVAVRRSSHPVADALTAALGRPLTATSANPAGGDPAFCPEELDPGLRAGLDGVVSCGVLAPGPASTLVSCLGPRPVVLREGAIPAAELGLDAL